MTPNFDILENVKKLPVKEDLYEKIISRIEMGKLIPLSHVKIVAAAFLCLISLEVYLSSNATLKTNDTSFLSEIVPSTNNMLYYD